MSFADGVRRAWARVFEEEPTFRRAWSVFFAISAVLFTRPLLTDFVSDERAALMRNAYLREPTLGWSEAFRRDFWGHLPSETSVGGYRPIPNLLWRSLALVGDLQYTPFFHHFANVVLHALNGALIAWLVGRVSRNARIGWLAGTFFVVCAISTEAVCPAVGAFDVLALLGVLLALSCAGRGTSAMAAGVFGGTLFALLSKESATAAVAVIPIAVGLLSPAVAPAGTSPRRRAVVAFVATLAAFVVSVELRRRQFPVPEQADLFRAGSSTGMLSSLQRWYGFPLPARDPINNPLIEATGLYRIAGAFGVIARSASQVALPATLSGDYSAAQETVPTQVVSLDSAAGVVVLLAPLLAGTILALRAARAIPSTDPAVASRRLLALALLWPPLLYLPVSNLVVLIGTVRGDRLWYAPVAGTSVLLALATSRLIERFPRRRGLVIAGIALFLGMQGFAARRHANDYRNDVSFWEATLRSSPRSAKAHLNVGALAASVSMERSLALTRRSVELAPDWPMANVYLGDALCEMGRWREGWPYYAKGFALAPEGRDLVALGLQCLWKHGALHPDSQLWRPLLAAAGAHRGTWMEWLVVDLHENGEKNAGVDRRYRAPAYSDGPKLDEVTGGESSRAPDGPRSP
jgi:hypothetical protein